MKIIILTAEAKNFVPVELQKAAQAANVESHIVDITKIVVREEDGASMLFLMGDEGLGELKVDADTIVIPRLNEYHLDTKIGILKKMENMGAVLINTAESMELCNDKLMSQIVLNNAGIKTPASWVMQDADQFDSVVKDLEARKLINFPIIMKTFRGTHGIGVMKMDSRSSVVSVGQTLLKEGIDFMLQEFCEHEQSCRIIMKGGQLLAANLRGQPKESGEFRTNSHLGSETQPYEPSVGELDLAQKIVQLFGANFCAIDYIVVKKKVNGEKVAEAEEAPAEGKQEVQKTLLADDTEIIILEVNGSPGLEAISKNWPERNLAAEVIEYAVSRVAKSEPSPELAQKMEDDLKAQAAQAAYAADNPSLELDKLEAEITVARNDQLGLVEIAIIHRVIDDGVEAKVDTGAKTSSLHVDDIEVQGQTVKFTRNETTYRVPLYDTRHVKSHDGVDESVERPIVLLDTTLKGVRVNSVEFSLINRSHMKYEVLIGRNVIEQLGLPVVITPVQPDPNGAAPAEVDVDGAEEE
jgi:ribosomal protein S6--L-glutamate ligase